MRRSVLLPRFSVGSLLWLCLLVAVLLLWYRDRSSLLRQLAVQSGLRSPDWSIDQLLGPPDTKQFGDIPTAWASRTPDSGKEIIVVEFPKSVDASAVTIVETYNPGAISKVSTVSATGTETILWEGKDPIGTSVAGGASTISFPVPTKTRRLKIEIDSQTVPGWNEIDAIGLVDVGGNCQWASSAWASSSYGFNHTIPRWYWP